VSDHERESLFFYLMCLITSARLFLFYMSDHERAPVFFYVYYKFIVQVNDVSTRANKQIRRTANRVRAEYTEWRERERESGERMRRWRVFSRCARRARKLVADHLSRSRHKYRGSTRNFLSPLYGVELSNRARASSRVHVRARWGWDVQPQGRHRDGEERRMSACSP